jgi:hypothetical protein
MNPIVTALLFYLIFTPAGFILRLARKDPLGLSFDPDASSYWNPRASSGDSSMANQF